MKKNTVKPRIYSKIIHKQGSLRTKTKDELVKELKNLKRRTAKLELSEAKFRLQEKNLRESEEHFRAVAQTAVDAVISADSKGKIIFWNRGAQIIFGYPEKEVLGKYLTILMPKRYRTAHRKGVNRVRLTGKSQYLGKTLEMWGLKSDGTEFPLELSVVTWKTGKGQFYTAIIRDITQRKQLEHELEILATTDKLTGAYNRTKFHEIIEGEIERAKRYIVPLSMIMFDIDYFKLINDTYGHAVGDSILKTISDLVHKHIRKIDYLIRWGGEEFMIISSETNLTKAYSLAERIRKIIENYKFDEAGKVTVSFGVTEFEDKDTEDTFIKRADAALYKAKGKGRNRVEVIPP